MGGGLRVNLLAVHLEAAGERERFGVVGVVENAEGALDLLPGAEGPVPLASEDCAWRVRPPLRRTALIAQPQMPGGVVAAPTVAFRQHTVAGGDSVTIRLRLPLVEVGAVMSALHTQGVL